MTLKTEIIKQPVRDFITFLFGRVNRETLIPGTYFGDIPAAVPSRYLMGTYGQNVTQWLLDYAYKKHYSSMPRARYDELTTGWVANHYKVYDCQGLLDDFAGVDINAKGNYNSYCSKKGEEVYNLILNNPQAAAGACVFKGDSPLRIHHVGFVVGVAEDGEPLIIEAKSLERGIIMSRFSQGNWNYFGLCDGLLIYNDPALEPTVFKVTSPLSTGEKYRLMQEALKANGYDPGAINGKWGKNSQAAFENMIARNRKPRKLTISIDGENVDEIEI